MVILSRSSMSALKEDRSSNGCSSTLGPAGPSEPAASGASRFRDVSSTMASLNGSLMRSPFGDFGGLGDFGGG